jgi:hypothetical protein
LKYRDSINDVGMRDLEAIVYRRCARSAERGFERRWREPIDE